MEAKTPPVETIENRWDILYRDYPEIYDKFASFPYKPDALDHLKQHFDLKGQRILDIGSGSGKSSFQLASIASHVTGVEPETSMLNIARKVLVERALNNVDFLEGSAQNIPVPDSSYDVVTAVTTVFHPVEETLPPFIKEATRVVRPGGTVICVNIAPGYYGGDLHGVIDDKAEDLPVLDNMLADNGFDFIDVDSLQDYGTVDNIVATYGFIFGRSAINYLRENGKTTITWRIRMRFKRNA